MRKIKRSKPLKGAMGSCILCRGPIEGMGHNPAPVSFKGRCCDVCNTIHVVPERIRLMRVQGAGQ